MLVDWQTRRNDKKTELHWQQIRSKRSLTSWEEWQEKHNFIETDYSVNWEHGRLDLMNPAFTFPTKLMKYWK